MKKCVIVSAVTALATIALIVIVIAGIKIVPSLFLTEEERVLRDFMGEYIYCDYAFAIDFSLRSSRAPTKDEVSPTKLIISEDSLETIYVGSDPVIRNDVKYLCKKVDDDLMENGLSFQGRALRNFFPSNEAFHETSEIAYIIFTDTPATRDIPASSQDRDVFYYVNGAYYYAESLISVYELKKIS